MNIDDDLTIFYIFNQTQVSSINITSNVHKPMRTRLLAFAISNVNNNTVMHLIEAMRSTPLHLHLQWHQMMNVIHL
jgi:hypothetical protein